MSGLDWEDVDLFRRFLRVKRGKNGESRYVRLNSVAVKALTKLKERSDGTGAVIRNPTGTALPPRHWFPDAVEKAGIENFHCTACGTHSRRG
jgi:integrase